MKRIIFAIIVGLICLTAQAQYVIKGGKTSQSIDLAIVDSTGAALGTLAYNTGSFTAYYQREGGSSTSITLATLSNATSAFNSGGFIAIDSTHMTGLYRLDIPDAADAAGADYVYLTLQGAASMSSCFAVIHLTAVDDQSATNFEQGLNGFALGAAGGPAKQAASGSFAINGGLVTANATQFNGSAVVQDGGILRVHDAYANDVAMADTATAIKAQPDKLAFSVSNQVDVNVLDWKGSTAPAMTGDAFNRLGAPAGASVSADIAAVKTDSGAIKTKTDSLTFTAPGLLDSNVLDWKGSAAPAMTGDAFSIVNDSGFGNAHLVRSTTPANTLTVDSSHQVTYNNAAPPTAAQIATSVWQDLVSGSDFTTAGSAGSLLANNLDARVSSRSIYDGSDTSGVTTLVGRLTSGRASNLDNLDASVSAVKSKTDQLAFTVSNHVDATADVSITQQNIDDIAAAAAGAATGDGEVTINHNYGGADALRIMQGINPIANARIDAYLATDTGLTHSVGRTYSGTDGRWVAPLKLSAGSYILVISKPGAIQTKQVTLTVN